MTETEYEVKKDMSKTMIQRMHLIGDHMSPHQHGNYVHFSSHMAVVEMFEERIRDLQEQIQYERSRTSTVNNHITYTNDSERPPMPPRQR